MRSPACSRQKNATFYPHILGTWGPWISRSLYAVTAKNHVVIQLLIGEIFDCDCGAISGFKSALLDRDVCISASLVDGSVKEPVEQAGVVVVAHREPESPH